MSSSPKVVRGVTYLLALIFLASGSAKLLALPFELEAFARWGYSPAFMYLTGILEVAGGIGLLWPRVSALASLCLAGLMIGAVATHVMHAEWPMMVLATGILALAAWRTWVGRCDIRNVFES